MKRCHRLVSLLLPLVLLMLLLMPISAQASSVLQTLEEYRDYVYYHVQKSEASIIVSISKDLFEDLRKDDGILFAELTHMCGIYKAEVSYTPLGDSVMLYLQHVTRYPGLRILQAVQKDAEVILARQDREALAVARQLLPTEGTLLEKERAIHDVLCDWIEQDTEAPDSPTDSDTAIGALLNHKADCDGYADAFFLLCGLAGIESRHIFGYTTNRDILSIHAWNAVCIDDQWVMTDLYWDDGPGNNSTLYFNIGADLMAVDHSWNAELLDYELETLTDQDLRSSAPAFVPATDYFMLETLIQEQAETSLDRFCFMVSDGIMLENSHDAYDLYNEIYPILENIGISHFWYVWAPGRFEIINQQDEMAPWMEYVQPTEVPSLFDSSVNRINSHGFHNLGTGPWVPVPRETRSLLS